MKILGACTALLLFAAICSSQTSNTLPPKVAALVPSGATLIGGNFGGSPSTAAADFTAERRIDLRRTVQYGLKLVARNTNSPAWRMARRGDMAELEQKVASAREGVAPDLPGVLSSDPVKETKYGWGTGLTQRVHNQAPQSKGYEEYYCRYYGLVGGVRFELSVGGAPDAAEADSWAQKVAAAAEQISVSNIGEK